MNETLRQLLDAVESISLMTCYASEDDTIGCHPCCGEVSYGDHASDCELDLARNLAKRLRYEMKEAGA